MSTQIGEGTTDIKIKMIIKEITTGISQKKVTKNSETIFPVTLIPVF